MEPKYKQVGNYYVNWNRVDTEINFWNGVIKVEENCFSFVILKWIWGCCCHLFMYNILKQIYVKLFPLLNLEN